MCCLLPDVLLLSKVDQRLQQAVYWNFATMSAAEPADFQR